ncbi:CBO0543 family protein [Alkalihalobacillus sp. CinArs1]|uniref:CBO0543 family protein n=1 Tax=Alkalihalobacillus sp. CinArs1 TaxID=2995314 RepID=UPI0022DE8EDE|nr:CBO0543 family protein [Alkalihalobacillus sp. CinArs1]
MNLFLVALVFLFAILKGDWKNWESYYPSMLYISLASFLYEFISHSHFHLWELHKDHFFNLMNVHFVHNLIINPLVAFVFLSHYPSGIKKQVLYTLKWIVIFGLIEWIGTKMDVISYHNGWHFGWSILFVMVMFPMVRLHHIHKLAALVLSCLMTFLYLLTFNYL